MQLKQDQRKHSFVLWNTQFLAAFGWFACVYYLLQNEHNFKNIFLQLRCSMNLTWLFSQFFGVFSSNS